MIEELGTKTLRSLFGGNISTAQVLQGIAAGMSACGVKVVIDPGCACPYAIIREKKIVLPATVKSERALLVVNWFIDHEASHLVHTPDIKPFIEAWCKNSLMLDVLKKHGINKFPDSLLMAAKNMFNLAEDARIEKLMIQRIPGTRKHFIGGPIASGLADMIEDMVNKAKELQADQNLPEFPINPFWAAQMHVFHLLDGTHQRKPRNHVRKMLAGHSVEAVLDIAEDEFGDIKDPDTVTTSEMFHRTDKAMSRIFELVLDQMEQQPEDEEEGAGDQQQGEGSADSNPFQNKFSKSKQKGKGAKSDEGADSEDEPSEDGEGEGEEGEESENNKGKGKGKSKSKSEDEGEEESEGSASGEGDNEGEEEGNDDDGEGESEGDESEENEGDGDESDSGEGDEEGDSDEQIKEMQQEAEENADVANDAQAQADQKLPPQIEEWAKDATADVAELMRGAESKNEAPDGLSSGQERTTQSGNPMCDPTASADGMPEKYFQKMIPGGKTIFINSADISQMINKKNFATYDEVIRRLMPPNLGPAARRLVGKFKDAPGEAWTGKRINPRRLGQIQAGTAYDKKIFIRKNQTIESRRGLAVMMLVDCSGSMTSSIHGAQFSDSLANSKFAMAHAGARGIAKLLQAVNVPFAVGGFTTTYPEVLRNSSRWGGGWSRDCDLVHFLFKDFHEPWPVSEFNMLAMNSFSEYQYKGQQIYSNCNSDGEAVLWAATQLLARDEDTKVLIVLSDGLPAGGDRTLQCGFLKWAIKRSMLAGIRVGAFGLGCQDVKFYYPISEILDVFPPGQGTDETAPYLIQEKLLSLIDRVMSYEEV